MTIQHRIGVGRTNRRTGLNFRHAGADTIIMTTRTMPQPTKSPVWVRCPYCGSLDVPAHGLDIQCHTCGFTGQCDECGEPVEPPFANGPHACSTRCERAVYEWKDR